MKRWLVWFGVLAGLLVVDFYFYLERWDGWAVGLFIAFWLLLTAIAAPFAILRWLIFGKREKQGQSVSIAGR